MNDLCSPDNWSRAFLLANRKRVYLPPSLLKETACGGNRKIIINFMKINNTSAHDISRNIKGIAWGYGSPKFPHTERSIRSKGRQKGLLAWENSKESYFFQSSQGSQSFRIVCAYTFMWKIHLPWTNQTIERIAKKYSEEFQNKLKY